MRLLTRLAFDVVIAAVLILGLAALGAGARAAEPEIYQSGGGLVGQDHAAGGYDAVAYFTDGKPTKGSTDFATEWKGATWLFASAANRDAFVAAPEKYAPQFGGYCAWAVAHGYTASGDPEVWSVVDGKLYLNYDKDVQTEWEKDVPRYIADGDKNWPTVLAQ